MKRRWWMVSAPVGLLAVVAAVGAPGVSGAQSSSDALVSYEISTARIRLALPDWQVRTADESRCIRRTTTTGSDAFDEAAARAQDTIDRSGRVSELVLVRDRGLGVTPVVRLWVNPSDSRAPVVELLRRGMPVGEQAPPGLVVLEGPRPLSIEGIGDAGLVRFRSRAAIRGGEMREAESITVQVRHAGHLVTLRLTTPLESERPPHELFASVIASIAPLP